ncbi:hypothetical protein AN639_01585 [Candidatus Epulonipiscium fishelsonii]|uniref:Uncharacterized protein n=1 Tax=Candidatus Epulonipiscium fishelsonii TaxID=77094 RepID=A0ACC8XBA1_9FIRM|nr:hypothetical protein AN639_01585 [Epulopiscium sp. SCG-B05WGA-EpuloA1]ONI39707.1 hypothetical protein AN396_07495 [Epulopiscium sp. SCG-B11WGA-EpuloA1]
MNSMRKFFSILGIMLILSGCTNQTKTGDVEKMEDKYRVGTKVPPLLEHTPTPLLVDVKAKGYEYDEQNLEYELVFADEFDVDGVPNPENWDYDIGGHGWGNNELQYYTRDNVVVKDGYLEIEARKEQKEGMEYTSTRLVSRNKQDFLYGKIEVRAKLPSGLGTWPAIWMLSTDWEYGGWPHSGEIDIMEHVGYDQNRIHGSVHTLSYYHSINTQKTATIVKAGVSDEFHVYAVEWLPDKVKVSLDGEVYFEYNPNDYVSNPSFKEWPFDKRMHLILNIAVGGFWGGLKGIDDTIFPQKMLIDYVRVYQSPQFSN